MNQPAGKSLFLQKVMPYRTRAAELAVGLTANKLMDWPFNYVLYPFIVYTYGILYGGFLMTLFSLLACLLTLKFYDWSQRDWLGIEAIKELKDYGGAKKFGRWAAWFLRKSDPFVFVFLTFWYDPFITAVYLRKGKFNGMAHRDWRIFFGSLFICNGYWTLACYMGITLVEWAWQGVKRLVV